MALKPAICTQCGAKIEVDDTHEFGVCNQCGTEFVTETVIQQSVNNVNIENATIVQQGFNPYFETVDKCISLMNDSKYSKLEAELTVLIDAYPHKAMARLLCADFQLHVLKILGANGNYTYTARGNWVDFKKEFDITADEYDPKSPNDRPPSISLIPPIPGSEGIYAQIFPALTPEENEKYSDIIESFRTELLAFFEVMKNQDEMVEKFETVCRIERDDKEKKSKKSRIIQLVGFIALSCVTAGLIITIILHLCGVF